MSACRFVACQADAAATAYPLMPALLLIRDPLAPEWLLSSIVCFRSVTPHRIIIIHRCVTSTRDKLKFYYGPSLHLIPDMRLTRHTDARTKAVDRWAVPSDLHSNMGAKSELHAVDHTTIAEPIGVSARAITDLHDPCWKQCRNVVTIPFQFSRSY